MCLEEPLGAKQDTLGFAAMLRFLFSNKIHDL